MLRSFKFRLYPSRQNKALLQSWLSACRSIYNYVLAERKNAWKNERRKVTYLMQQNALPKLKQRNPVLAEMHSQVLQDVLRRMDKAFKNFYSRVKKGQKPGYPRFKGADRYSSFTFPQSGFELEGKKLLLSKIGPINIRCHRQINGTIKTCTIKQEAGKWYAIFAADVQPAPQPSTKPAKAIGMDAGLQHLITLSTGLTIAHPKFYKKAEQLLAFEQRHLSRKKKGSKNRMKQKLQIQKLHLKTANKRQDFLHKLSRQFVDEYGIIAYENLEIQNMQMRNTIKLSKSMADASWGILMRMLDYKAEEAGSQVIKVSPEYTSQDCSCCGARVKKALSTRTHRCMGCGFVLDRDHNAAINILRKGLGKLLQQRIVAKSGNEVAELGQELPELSPVGDAQKEAPSMKQEASTFR